jgi:hypothetical protein
MRFRDSALPDGENNALGYSILGLSSKIKQVIPVTIYHSVMDIKMNHFDLIAQFVL